MNKIYCFLFLFSVFSLKIFGQETYPINGVHQHPPQLFAFKNATIVVNATTTINNGVLLVKGNSIQEVGTNLNIPDGYSVVDLKGAYVYPGLIDVYASYGIPEAKGGGNDRQGPQFLTNKQGAFYWNEAVKPEINSVDLFTVNNKRAEDLRNNGFGAVLTFQKDGIVRPTSCFVSLANDKENNVLLANKVSNNFSFNKGVSTQDYPSALMGSIALLRQTFLDAEWYQANKGKVETNLSLEALNNNSSLINIFEINEMQDVARVSKLFNEFNKKTIIKGCGSEYQRMSEVVAAKTSFILPLKFPKAMEVEDLYSAAEVSLSEMKHWELAPSNPALFEKNKIEFALTPSDNETTKEFFENLRLAIDYGLSKQQALKSLTEIPAKMIGQDKFLGSIERGKLANFIICSKELFDKKNIIYQTWVQGKQYDVNPFNIKDIRATYTLSIDQLPDLKMDIKGDVANPEIEITYNDSIKVKSKNLGTAELPSFYFSFSEKNKKLKTIKGEELNGNIQLVGILVNPTTLEFKGDGQLPNATKVRWTALQKNPFTEKSEKADSNKYVLDTGAIIYPFTSFGNKIIPTQNNYLIKNATVWTSEADGTLENTDVLVVDGKISAVGQNLQPTANSITIDAKGKHVTPGIIDEHSHIAISRGVNEGTQAVTSEVRIGDVLDDADVNIYRQLSGGVTTSHLLHGSANPIGGQTALIKLRWGKSPEAMKFENADGFIKFALGENVKQSNWGDYNTTRFPQTRMGVEQVFYDAFKQAKKYEAEHAEAAKKNLKPRKDLEMEALVEILNSKRFITCHSYVQSEINMLMHVADSMGFTVNTFTHILEGYKVADKMKAHGVSASTFSDWWAYKYEVIDAIPHNASILSKVGVNTCINSDDAEMARRLNQEAAKSVMYSGMSETDALKMVTINPAKALHIDQRVGSIKVGKDADLVIWNNHPLSIYASVENTLVDGVMYFDKKLDAEKRVEIAKEKTRLMQKMIDAKNKGEKTSKPSLKTSKLYHCDDITNDGNYNE